MVGVVYENEKEKVKARESGQHVGTYSVHFGNSFTHSDSYSAANNINFQPIGNAFSNNATKDATKFGSSAFTSFLNEFGKSFGSSLDPMEFIKNNFKTTEKQKEGAEEGDTETTFDAVTAASKWKFKFNVVADFGLNYTETNEISNKKSTGFSLAADDMGDLTVSVYRAQVDSVWENATAKIRDKVDISDLDQYLYGNYVFYTEAGSTYCIHEEEETTKFYNPGTVLSNPTMKIAAPELSIDTYEQANVPSDQKAIFQIELRNSCQVQYGLAGEGTAFTLQLNGDSNPNGAKVYINGALLVQQLTYFLLPGQTITQTLEVERGTVDDYNDLTLFFYVADCIKNYTMLKFSVHFLPESSPVAVASPRQGWIMNTLSPQDETGYYLPIDINGFNIRQKNFDHIEFQYKLTSQSDDEWVNQCSFYATTVCTTSLRATRR